MSNRSNASARSTRAALRSGNNGQAPDNRGTQPPNNKGFSPERVADIRDIVNEMIAPVLENISAQEAALTALRTRVDSA